MEQLTALLMMWIVANSDYTMHDPPQVQLVDNVCAAIKRPPCPHEGLYDPATETIYLAEGPWHSDDTYNTELSEALLVHELTHYLQDMAVGLLDINFQGVSKELVQTKCVQEAEAYMLQAKYLKDNHNLDFFRHAMISSQRACGYAWQVWRKYNQVTP